MAFRSPIFSNPSSAERARLAALIDLIDAVKLTMEGHPVTVDVVRSRIRKLDSERQAERVMQRIIQTSEGLGYDAWRAPFSGALEGGMADPRGRGSIVTGGRSAKRRGSHPARDEMWIPGRWALRFDRPQELMETAQAAVEAMLEETTDGARRYALIKDLGLCVGCRKTQPRPGKVHCADCAAEARERRERMIDDGVCPACRGPLGPGQSTCSRCLAGDRAQESERRRRGLCPHCGQNEPAPGRKVCALCAESESSYHAKRYRDLKARGLCRCKRPLEPGRSTCADCRRKQEEAEVRRQERRRSQGLCLKCGQPVASGFVLCQRHLDLQAKRSVAKRAAAAAAGVCRSCGEPWAGPQIDCAKCRSEFAEHKARLEAAGLCRDCGERPPISGRNVCQRCVDMAKGRYDQRKAAGLCVHCETPVERIGDATCRECRRASADRYARKRSGSE